MITQACILLRALIHVPVPLRQVNLDLEVTFGLSVVLAV